MLTSVARSAGQSFGILGPLVAHRTDGACVTFGAPKHRTVAALLLVNGNSMVGIDEFVDELWPVDPPASAVANLRTYVSQVRRALALTSDQLSSHGGGYLLRLDPERFDVDGFHSAVRAARMAVASDDLANGADLLRQGLDLWRGRPLEDVPVGARLRAHATALAEERVSATEELLRCRLAMGEHAETISALRRLTLEHPLRESAWALLITALYCGGNVAAALAAFNEVRALLAESLGADPGPELMALNVAVLRGDDPPGLAPLTTRSPAPGTLPRELPAPPVPFVGRSAMLDRLGRAVLAPVAPVPGRPAVVAIHGPAGVGKSALALWLAQACAADFPDGQLYVDLRGSTEGMAHLEPAEVLARFLRALGDRGGKGSAAELEARFRSAVSGRRLLVVLDNAADPAQVRPLLPASAASAVIVTSRAVLSTLDGAVHAEPGVLSTQDALDLLDALAPGQVRRDGAAAAELARRCGYLPLALRVAGARLTGRPEWTLKTLVDRLADERSRLDELGYADLDVRSSLAVGYDGLLSGDELDRAAAIAFRRTALAPVADFDATLVSVATGTPAATAERLLDRLVAARLVEPVGCRYRIHDLTRLFGRERARAEESAGEPDEVVGRIADWYIATAGPAGNLVRTHREVPRGPAVGPGGGAHADGGVPGGGAPGGTPHQAAAWLEREAANLPALARILAQGGPALARRALRLADAVYPMLLMRSSLYWVQLGEATVPAARQLGDERYLRWIQIRLAAGYAALHDPDRALRYGAEALASCRAAGAEEQLPDALEVYGVSLVRAQRPADAVDYFLEAITLFHTQGRPAAAGRGLNNLAESMLCLGRNQECLALLRRSLAIRRQTGDRAGEAVTLCNLTDVHVAAGQLRTALRLSEAALALARRTGHTSAQAETACTRISALLGLGRIEEALAESQDALALCDMTHKRHTRAAMLRAIADALAGYDHPQQAEFGRLAGEASRELGR